MKRQTRRIQNKFRMGELKMGYQNMAGNGFVVQKKENSYFDLEWELRQFSGRNTKTLSSRDKDTIIACMSAIIDVSAKGVRPTPSMLALIREVGYSCARDLDGQSAGFFNWHEDF